VVPVQHRTTRVEQNRQNRTKPPEKNKTAKTEKTARIEQNRQNRTTSLCIWDFGILNSIS